MNIQDNQVFAQDVTGVLGQTAYLTCRVFDRTNETVRKKNVVSFTKLTILINYLFMYQSLKKIYLYKIQNTGVDL